MRHFGGSFVWAEIPAPNPPSARFGHAAVYEETTIPIGGTPTAVKRMIMFGGTGAPGQTPSDNNVYELRLTTPTTGTWHVIPQVDLGDGFPSPRFGHSLTADTTRRERTPGQWGKTAFLFGGELGSSSFSNEFWVLWTLENGTCGWRKRTLTGAPTARARHSAVFDIEQSQGRLYLFGGEATAPADRYVYVVHPLTGNSWVQWAQMDANLSGHTMVLDRSVTLSRINEIHDPGSATLPWHAYSNAPFCWNDSYPMNFVIPGGTGANGRILTVGTEPQTHWLDLPAPGQLPAQGWQTLPGLNSGFVGVAGVQYRPGKIVVAGGTVGATVVGTTKSIDATNLAAGWQNSASMAARNYHNLVVLPDGKVLAVGGNGTLSQLNDSPVRKPQLWDPNGPGGGTWTALGDLAEQPTVRGYHSTAILLPDGRVLSSGGESHNDKYLANLYCPPYLFQPNGSLAERPIIAGAPDTVVYGQRFTICTLEAATVSSACLIRPSATTHGFDQNQKFVPLTIRDRCTQQLIVDGPVNADHAPPGYYMLFILSDTGVPAVARWVRVLSGSAWDDCDTSSPAQVGAYTVADVGYKSATLTWTSPGDDANCGEAQVTEVRVSTSAITEANWNLASVVTTLVPGPNGTPHCLEVSWTGVGCGRHFAIRTRDDRYLWSGVSNLHVQGDCSGFEIPTCGESGLYSQGWDEGGWSGENSILWEGAAAGAFDRHRMKQAPAPGPTTYRTRLFKVGAGKAELDHVELAVVDHDSSLEAFPAEEGVLLGTTTAIAGAVDRSGVSITSQVDGSTGVDRMLDRGQPIVVSLGTAVGPNTGLVVEGFGYRPGIGPDSSGVLVQVPESGGQWRTVSHIRPRRVAHRFAVPSQGNSTMRLLFLGRSWIRSVRRLNISGNATPQSLTLLRADHSASGDARDAVRSSGGSVSTLRTGEALELEFERTTPTANMVRALFLQTKGGYSSLTSSSSRGLAPVASQEIGLSLEPALPNPASGRTRIQYVIAEPGHIRLTIYDVSGRLVRSLVNGEVVAGLHETPWDGLDESGAAVSPGVYFYRLEAGGSHREKKLIVITP
ncbi:MAG: galactose oxidase-like domain-containing protein [Candidatus Eiseniibacteriota bacterium]